MGETAMSPSAEQRLVFQDHRLVHIHSQSSQWVDIQTFTFTADIDDRAVVELLLQHVRYRHSYAGPVFYDMKIIHGPYWLEAITAESFSPVTATAAEALITTWANYDFPMPDSAQVTFEQFVYPPIRAASSIYQLADLRATAEHDWGSVIGFTGFHELLAVDRDRGRLTLIVASDD